MGLRWSSGRESDKKKTVHAQAAKTEVTIAVTSSGDILGGRRQSCEVTKTPASKTIANGNRVAAHAPATLCRVVFSATGSAAFHELYFAALDVGRRAAVERRGRVSNGARTTVELLVAGGASNRLNTLCRSHQKAANSGGPTTVMRASVRKENRILRSAIRWGLQHMAMHAATKASAAIESAK